MAGAVTKVYLTFSAWAAILASLAAAGVLIAVVFTSPPPPCGGMTLVSRASGASGAKGNAESRLWTWSISADGRFVGFSSGASNLNPDDTDSTRDVFVRDLQTNQTILVSRATGASGAKGNGHSRARPMSEDGRFVAFQSEASNLHPDDTDTEEDAFVRDLQTNQTVLVSRASGASGTKGNGRSIPKAVSADGRFVTFDSTATNLHPDDTDLAWDAFVRDLQTNQTFLASRATGASGAKGNDSSVARSASGDGRFVGIQSEATNLHPDDTDTAPDVFVRDLQTNQTVLASRATGAPGVKANNGSFENWISADGRFVTLESEATNLHPDDTDAAPDVFVRDLQTNKTLLASRAAGVLGAKGNNASEGSSISRYGRFVAFQSEASNLHSDDADLKDDVFVRDQQTSRVALVSRAGAAGTKGNDHSGGAVISADGRFVAFESLATNLHSDDNDATSDVFIREPCPDEYSAQPRGSRG